MGGITYRSEKGRVNDTRHKAQGLRRRAKKEDEKLGR
jgi:hypothetical protein